MLKDQDRWEIRALHRNGNSIRHIRDIAHRDRKTIRNVLTALSPGAGASRGQPAKLRRSGKQSTLEPFKEFLLGALKRRICTGKLLLELRGRGFGGSMHSLRRFLRASKARIITTSEQTKDWMHLVLQGDKTSAQIKQDVGDALTGDEVRTLLECVRTKPLKIRNRALALLAHGNQITLGRIASFLCVRR